MPMMEKGGIEKDFILEKAKDSFLYAWMKVTPFNVRETLSLLMMGYFFLCKSK